jgi:hypothetical protein
MPDLQKRIERLDVLFIGIFSLGGIIPQDRSDGPAVGAVISLTPPAVGDAEVEDPVGHHLDAARAARLVGPPGIVEPDVHALDKMPGDADIIVLDEKNPSPETLVLAGFDHLLEDVFPCLVVRMRLAGEEDVHRTGFMVDHPGQTVQIRQEHIRPFVGGKSPRESDQQGRRIDA